MKDKILSRALPINDARVAAAFSNPLRRRLVLLLTAGERSLGEIADVTGVDLKRLHYHIGALVKLGLVEVAREQRRAGRPIKLYRAVAEAFFVPEGVMATPPGAARAAELNESLARWRARAQAGVLYHLGDHGEPLIRSVRGDTPKRAAAAELWRVLRLSSAEVLRLAAEIDERLKAGAAREGGGGETFLVHFAIAPRL